MSEHDVNQEPVAASAHSEASEQMENMSYPDATRLSRVFAWILDLIIVSLVSTPINYIFGLQMEIEIEQLLEYGLTPDQVIQGLQITIVGILVYALINSYHLWFFGQSLGKKLMKIAIVDDRGRVPSFVKIIGIRYALFQIILSLPGIFLIGLVDYLLIFRADRRCLHDILAGTRVIDVSDIGSGANAAN